MGKHSAPKGAQSKPQGRRAHSVLGFLGHLLLVFLVMGCAMLFFAERWLFDTWAALSVDEIRYHLSVSLEGTDTSTIWRFVKGYLPWWAAVVAALLVALRIGRRRGGAAHTLSVVAALAVSLGMAGYAVYDAGRKVNLSYYLPGIFSGQVDDGEDFIGDHYVDPSTAGVTFPEKKRNLVYIFLESMEMTYADEASGGAFERNVIPELTALAQANEDFSGSSEQLNGGIVFPGTDWTMGGMFAQTSGTPLKVPMAGEALAAYDELFPGMTTLGDLLAAQGYHQELLLGSDVKFGGRDAYFGCHGAPDIYDYVWAKESGFIPSDYKVFWGFEDEKLFELAKTRCTEAAKTGEPFNITMLTVDTHFEDGYVCRLCDDEFEGNQYANVMACSSRQVSAFVEWLQQQDFYDNTTIVVSGDHVTMDKNFCENVPDSYQRRTYVAVINPATQLSEPDRTRTYATFDLFPTTVAALGASIPGERLGIGTNLFSSTDTLAEEYDVVTLMRKLSRQSEFLNSYSNMAMDDAFMEEAAAKTSLNIDVLDDGSVRFWCNDNKRFKFDLIKAMKVCVSDSRTGKTTDLAMKVKQRRANDPNRYDCFVDTSYTEADLPYLSAKAYVSIGDYTDYLLAEWVWQPEEAQE